jgi:hypothetical protein
MLVYHPAYDVNHGMFRMLRLLEANPERLLRWDTFRILDIYYLFPHLLADAQLPRKFGKAKIAYGASGSKYTRAPAPKVFIQQMAGLHESIAISLVSKGFLQADAFKALTLQRTDELLPLAIRDAFVGADGDQALIELLAVDLAAIPLTGHNGLKERTGLLESYYDPA